MSKIEVTLPVYHSHFISLLICFALFILVSTQTKAQSPINSNLDPTSSNTDCILSTITGYVFTNGNKPLAYVRVALIYENNIIGAGYTNELGKYQITLPDSVYAHTKVDITYNTIGYQTKTIYDLLLNKNQITAPAVDMVIGALELKQVTINSNKKRISHVEYSCYISSDSTFTNCHWHMFICNDNFKLIQNTIGPSPRPSRLSIDGITPDLIH